MSTVVTEIRDGIRVVDEAMLYGRTWVDIDGLTVERDTVRFGTVEFNNGIETTDDTVTTVAEIIMPERSTMMVTARVLARRTGGAAGTDEDGLAYEIKAAFKNVAGVATQIGSTEIIFSEKDQISWDVIFDTSGANILIDVNGAIDNDVDWLCFYNTHIYTTIVAVIPP